MSTPHAQPVYGRWTVGADSDYDDDSCRDGPDRAPSDGVGDEPRGSGRRLWIAAAEELGAALGTAVYSVDGRNLEAVVGDLLREKRLTIAVAESCTGGLLTSRLTDVPGSSAYVERGFMCYSNRSKVELLGVTEALLAEHGAVSEPVAQAMAGGRGRGRVRTSASALPGSRVPMAARRTNPSVPSRLRSTWTARFACVRFNSSEDANR